MLPASGSASRGKGGFEGIIAGHVRAMRPDFQRFSESRRNWSLAQGEKAQVRQGLGRQAPEIGALYRPQALTEEGGRNAPDLRVAESSQGVAGPMGERIGKQAAAAEYIQIGKLDRPQEFGGIAPGREAPMTSACRTRGQVHRRGNAKGTEPAAIDRL